MVKAQNIKGIRIRTVNIIMLCLSIILFAIVLYTTVRLSRSYEASVKAADVYLSWEQAAHSLHVGSDFLTDQTRLFIQTGDREYADKFFNELYNVRSREKALELLGASDMMPEDDRSLQNSLELSNMLANVEIYAIRLVAEAHGLPLDTFPDVVRRTELSRHDMASSPQEKIERARELVYNKSYQNSKRQILTTLTSFVDKNLAATRVEMQQETDSLGHVVAEQRLVLFVLCLLNVLTFTMIILLIVRPLQIYLKCIRDDKMFELVGAYEFKHLALTYNDIFAIKEHHDKMLKYKAEHDPLTGLLNRSAFDSLQDLLGDEQEPVGLLLIDVDNFKHVNDTYGHAVGDATLRRVASLLQHNFRSNDFCIRIGGDEFAVILRGMDVDVEEIVKKKIASINKTLQVPLDNVPVISISVGGALSKSAFTKNLYTDADSALYEVKEAGRCGCRFYHSGKEKD